MRISDWSSDVCSSDLRRADATDRRVRRVFITDKGFETIHAMESVGAENNRNILVGISQDDLRVTEATLAKVKANIPAQLNGASLRAKSDSIDEPRDRKSTRLNYSH